MSISTAISPTRVARQVAIETRYKNLQTAVRLLPQRIAVVGQGATAASYSIDKKRVLSGFETGQLYGFGSPLHLAVNELLPANNDGVGDIPVTVYPLEDAPAGVAAAGAITPVGTQLSQQVYYVKINEIVSEPVVIAEDDDETDAIAAIIAAVNAVAEMPMLAADGTTKVDFTAKWKGETGNDLKIVFEGTEAGIVFTITQPTGGLVNPDVQPALDQFGETWETLILNCLNIGDTDILDKYNTFAELRWGPVKPKQCIFFTGNTETSVNTAVTVSDVRKTDRINSQLVAPASLELPLAVAARELCRIALTANENPPADYAGQRATGLIPGSDNNQWNSEERDFAVKAGSSTIEVIDSEIELSDTVTFYHPTGDPLPAYRYVADIIKIMNVTYVIRQIFEGIGWKGKVLLPDGQATVNRDARFPSTAISQVAAAFDALALEGIIADPETAKKSITAGINPTNPKRLDLAATYQISGNTNLISIDMNWGFYFGQQQLAA